MKWQKEFVVNGRKYIFDGLSVSIITDEISIPRQNLSYKVLNSQRSSTLKTLCLVLNNSCNLCCKYCFANNGMYNKPNEFMTFETAKKSIDFLIRKVRECRKEKITISFFVGEPLLSFKLIKNCVSYIESFKNINCKYMITTNGTLLTSEVVKYFQKYNFDIMISIDGNKKLHDFCRKFNSGDGSYDKVVRGINLFNQKDILNARITISNHNPEIHTYIEDILGLGIKRITFAVDYNISSYSFNLYVKSLKKLIDKYYYDLMQGKYYEITNFSNIIVSLALHQRKLTFCNAGISYLTVSADGKYYMCPRFVGNDDFSFFDVEESDKAKEKMEVFKKNLLNNPGERNLNCKNCLYVFICGGMCYHHAIASGKTIFENVPRECYQRMVMFEGIIQMVCRLPVENRRELLLFYITLWNSVKGGIDYV